MSAIAGFDPILLSRIDLSTRIGNGATMTITSANVRPALRTCGPNESGKKRNIPNARWT